MQYKFALCMMRVLKSFNLLSLTLLLTIVGCSSHQKPPPQTGFLTDYSRLKLVKSKLSVPYSKRIETDEFDRVVNDESSYSKLRLMREDSELLVFESSKAKINQFKKVIIEPVVFYPHVGVEINSLTEKERDKFSRELRRQITKALRDVYEITSIPGADTLRIRTAITNIHQNSPLVSLFLNAAADRAVIAVGGACVEIEGLNADTSEQIFAIVERKTADRVGLKAGLKKWEHTSQAFTHWAALVREILDRGRGVSVYGGQLSF